MGCGGLRALVWRRSGDWRAVWRIEEVGVGGAGDPRICITGWFCGGGGVAARGFAVAVGWL